MKFLILSACFLLVPFYVFANASHDSPSSGTQSHTHSAAPRSAASPDPGERVFATNCARCHMPPMALPQRITGTVLMHMRVRARLSRQDEQLLLRYMAP